MLKKARPVAVKPRRHHYCLSISYRVKLEMVWDCSQAASYYATLIIKGRRRWTEHFLRAFLALGA